MSESRSTGRGTTPPVGTPFAWLEGAACEPSASFRLRVPGAAVLRPPDRRHRRNLHCSDALLAS